MARPTRCRRVCCEPVYKSFAPCGSEDGEALTLSVDEFEAIRLIDLEKMTHEQCAEQMDISRTTVTEIYESARYKLADCIVGGKTLVIAGGNYRLCGGSYGQCKRPQCEKLSLGKERGNMKIAVTYENGQVFQHFGHTEKFKLYDVEDGKIKGEAIVDSSGSGHGALAGFLKDRSVEVLICGGIGGGAKQALAAAGIRLYGGVTGSADEAVKNLLAGSLAYNSDIQCSHHEHEQGHSCFDRNCDDRNCDDRNCDDRNCGENKHGCGENN